MAEATSILQLDASDFIGEAEAASDSMAGLTDESEDTQDSLIGLDDIGTKAAGAIAAVGGAMMTATERSKDWRESLGRASIDLGVTRDEAVGLARDISNATFPMEDAVPTLDSLGQQGVEAGDGLEETATAADNVGDATDQSAESISNNLGPAITSLGGEVTDLAEDQDHYTKVMRDLMLDAPELSKVLQQNADDFNEMGLGATEATDLLGAYGEQTGLTGRELRTNFREDLQAANGDLDEFQEITGISDEQLQDYNDDISKSGQLTSQYADSANDAVSPMDKLGYRIDELSLLFGDLIEPVEALGPALSGAGTAALALSASGVTASGAMGTLAGAAGLVSAPLLAIVAAIAAVVAAFMTDFMGIRTITENVIGDIRDIIDRFLGYVTPIFSDHLSTLAEEFTLTADAWRAAIAGFVDWARPYVESFLSFFSGLWDEHGDTITAIVDTLMSGVKRLFEDHLSIVVDVAVGFFRLLRGDFEGVKESILSIVDTLVSGVVDWFTWLYDTIVGNSIIPDLVSDVIEYVTDLKDDGIALIGDFADGAVDYVVGLKDDVTSHITTTKDNVVDTITGMKDTATGIVDDLAGEVVDTFDSLGSEAGDMFTSAFNSAIPASVDIPEVSINNPVPGESDLSIGGGSLNLPQLDTGGFIQSDGVAMLHSGEEVLPSAQVDRRGSGGSGGNAVDIDIYVDGSQSPESTARAIERRLDSAGVDSWRA